jgi:malate synthase
VAHPGLVPIAKAEFDAVMKEPNQIARKRRTCTSRPLT